MINNMYWISAFVFASILLLILINDYLYNDSSNKLTVAFRRMIRWVIFFCIQDAFWGLCDSRVINNDFAFFISSQIFHISTVLTTFFWLSYILTYLGDKVHYKKFFLAVDIIVILFEVILVTVNFWKPVVFSIIDGRYVTGVFRPVAFFNQYAVYLIIGILNLICAFRDRSESRNKFFTVFIFTLFPVLLGYFQFIFPDGPFYSMGYFLACFVIHIFVVAKEREAYAQKSILTSISDIYYSMHIIDLEKWTCRKILEPGIISGLVEGITDPQKMIDAAISGTACEEQYPLVNTFVQLSTLEQRLKNKTHISCEFVGKNYGWTRITIIAVNRNKEKLQKIIFTSQIIDEEKKEEIKLLFQSSHDEMTGLYNRRAYEDEISRLEEIGLDEELVYVSVDLNGLKTVNDTFGHAAGDEIIKGAAHCLKKCFGLYGKVFRIGGDEYCALVYLDPDSLNKVKADFEDIVLRWSGELVERLSVSTGYVCSTEFPYGTIQDLAAVADKRMYQAKNDYYKKSGVDRRGQKDAYTALCSLCEKILKINITHDSYQIVEMDLNEQTPEMGFDKSISVWLKSFGTTGHVHPDDLNDYLSKVDLENMRKYFHENKKALSFNYRRKIENEYKRVQMDLIPAADYTSENQSLFLYVKKID